MPSVVGTIRSWANAGLGLIYPEVCQICHKSRAPMEDGLVCGACRSQVRFIQPPFCDRCGLPFEGEITHTFQCTNCRELDLHFTSARSAVVLKTVVSEAMHAYKYNRAMWFERFLAGLLLQKAVPVLRAQTWDLIVPVPLHPTKLREREFNQAARLAKHLGAALNLRVDERSLQRVTATQTQTRLSRADRAKNVRGAFAMRKGVRLASKRVIVLDDMFTTGATTSDCARALRGAGAAEVCVWTVARGL